MRAWTCWGGGVDSEFQEVGSPGRGSLGEGGNPGGVC